MTRQQRRSGNCPSRREARAGYDSSQPATQPRGLSPGPVHAPVETTDGLSPARCLPARSPIPVPDRGKSPRLLRPGPGLNGTAPARSADREPPGQERADQEPIWARSRPSRSRSRWRRRTRKNPLATGTLSPLRKPKPSPPKLRPPKLWISRSSACRDPSSRDPSSRDPSSRDPSSRDPSSRDPSSRDPARSARPRRPKAQPCSRPGSRRPSRDPACRDPACRGPKLPKPKLPRPSPPAPRRPKAQPACEQAPEAGAPADQPAEAQPADDGSPPAGSHTDQPGTQSTRGRPSTCRIRPCQRRCLPRRRTSTG